MSIVFLIVLSLLTFPVYIPWMAAGWLIAFTWQVAHGHKAWVTLLGCALVLLVKGVPLVPSIVLFVFCLLVATAFRWMLKSGATPSPRFPWPVFAVVWLAWLYFSCEWHWIGQCNHKVQFDPERPVVCLGDSLTSGIIPDPGYPGTLKSLLTVPVFNLGQSGMASDLGLDRIQTVLEKKPQIVVIEIGGHDFLQGLSRAETKKNLLTMIQLCRAAQCEVVLAEIPRGFMVDPFRSLEREIAYEQDVQLIPDGMIRQLIIWSPFCPPGMWMPQSRLSDDGIHSNAHGGQTMARQVAMAIEKVVGPEIIAR